MKEEMKPCPFCGNDSLCLDGVEKAANFADQPRVECCQCHASGPIIDNGTFEEAVEAWNKRVEEIYKHAEE
jgi:Lar family restriction alleviation protein